MKSKYNVIAIVRTFNNPKIEEIVRKLGAMAEVNYIVITINTDTQNKGEENGSFTKNLLQSILGSQSSSKLIIHPVANWGKNPGSAAALNDATSEAFYQFGRLPTKKDIIFPLSVESQVTNTYVEEAINLFQKHEDLAVVGMKRRILIGEDEESKRLEGEFENKLQYKVPQNTAAFWRANLVRLAGGFRTECDFSGITIEIGGQPVPVAGMDDFPTLLYLVRLGYKWAMIGEENPVVWDLREVRKDPQRWRTNLNKMNRQETVISIWANKFHALSMGETVEILERGRLKL